MPDMQAVYNDIREEISGDANHILEHHHEDETDFVNCVMDTVKKMFPHELHIEDDKAICSEGG